MCVSTLGEKHMEPSLGCGLDYGSRSISYFRGTEGLYADFSELCEDAGLYRRFCWARSRLF